MNYQDGALVGAGDRVRYGNCEGYVEEIITKGTVIADHLSCKKDAVLVYVPSHRDRFLLYPDEEEDLILIARKP